MIAGVAAVPTTPLLVDGVTGGALDGLRPIAEATRAALECLSPSDVTVLVAGSDGDTPVLYATAESSLTGIGRPDLRMTAAVDRPGLKAIARAAGCPVARAGLLPLDLAVLAQLYSQEHGPPLVPVAVPRDADPQALVALGCAIASVLGPGPRRATMVAAADLSAGRTEQAPLALVPGAAEWDDAVIDIVAGGRLDRLVTLGPAGAQRVGARGWASLVVLHAVCRRAKLAMVVRACGAPRGVAYLVASAR